MELPLIHPVEEFNIKAVDYVFFYRPCGLGFSALCICLHLETAILFQQAGAQIPIFWKQNSVTEDHMSDPPI